ncbi:MAG: lipoprotein-releasing ABC transporter permease subunit [Deltaproteobacteria bacterium]|nr:lipoprotein-releasing ABC transporter permease subunit [Deltaproteobacteria bacterium]
MSFEFYISRRYMRSKHKQAFISFITVLSMAGVTVGVMALIIVIAVMSGAESYFKSKILGVEPNVIIRRHGGAITGYSSLLERIKKEKDVVALAPFIDTQVMLKSKSGLSGSVLRGVDPKASGTEIMGMKRADIKEKLAPASLDTGNASFPGIILGRELADRLGVSAGSALYIISPSGMLSPVGYMPAMRRFTVTGIFSSGFYEYDASLAYINLSAAQRLLRLKDGVTGIGVKLGHIYDANLFATNISEKLGFPFWAVDWMDLNRNFFSALKLEKTAMFVILTLIILVAAFNIASTLIMMVMSKTRDIAILKAMGATERSIRKIFVLNGLFIGMTGTALGASLGVFGCFLLKHYKFIHLPGDVYYFTTLPVKLEWPDITAIVAAAMIICFLSTLYPAKRASSQDPAEALRYG